MVFKSWWLIVWLFHTEHYSLHNRPIKLNCGHFDKIFIAGCTRSCRMTTSGAASDENFVKMTTIPFQWSHFLPFVLKHIWNKINSHSHMVFKSWWSLVWLFQPHRMANRLVSLLQFVRKFNLKQQNKKFYNITTHRISWTIRTPFEIIKELMSDEIYKYLVRLENIIRWFDEESFGVLDSFWMVTPARGNNWSDKDWHQFSEHSAWKLMEVV